jgi:hypothetical protein
MNTIKRIAALSLLLSSLDIWGAAGEPRCRYVELPSTRSDGEVRYENATLPWSVTSVDLSGTVSIWNRKSGATCAIKTDSDAAPKVYASTDSVALRIVEISSDDVIVYDGFTCREQSKVQPLHLGTHSPQDKARKLHKAGFCQTDSKP